MRADIVREHGAATAAIMAASESVAARPNGAAKRAPNTLIVKSDGTPHAILANAITKLRTAPEWKGVLAFNEFSLQVTTLKPAPWGGSAGKEWTDHEDRLTADWLQHHRILVPVKIAAEAIQTVSRDRICNPVREYLEGTHWDGRRRIDGWLSMYLGVAQSNYTCAVGARWLIAAVARIFAPGAKVDSCLILEGEQGSGKSRALKTLGGDWYTDEMSELGSKEAAIQTRGIWIIELAELEAMTRAEVCRIKAFMSRATDRFRPPYASRPIESPRQCIFAGSVNHSTGYLRDETGGRRFWPIQCSRIELDALARARDQLFAEATQRYKAGTPWWLDSGELNQAAAEEQIARYDGDPWDDNIRRWAEGRADISIDQVLTVCLEMPKHQWTQVHKNRIARSLRAQGWERFRGPIEDNHQWPSPFRTK
jgi:predicted P-loop ATPase